MSLCILPAILQKKIKNVSRVFKSATRQWSLSFRQNQLTNFELIFPLSSLPYSLLKTNPQRVYWCHCKFLKRGKSPLDVWWARWPPYISHSLHRQRLWKSVILLSSAVQMETTLSIIHHLHSTTCNAERLLSPPRSPHLCSFKGRRGCIQTAGYTLS